MKHRLLFLCFLISLSCGFAKARSIQSIVTIQPLSIQKVDSSRKDNRIYISSSFSSPAILSDATIQHIKGLVIYRIDLVYTTYRSSPSFNQQALNKKRLQALQAICPELFKNNLITWRLIAQDAPTNPQDAKALFHGFILYHRPAGSAEQTAKEIDYINALLAGKKTGIDPFPIDDPIIETKKNCL